MEAALTAAVARQDFGPFEEYLTLYRDRSKTGWLRTLRRATGIGGARATDLLRRLIRKRCLDYTKFAAGAAKVCCRTNAR